MTKEYTDEQYKKFLYHQFNYNFGISEEKMVNYFWDHIGTSGVVAGESLTRENMNDTYLPLIKSMLGKQSYVMFLNIMLNENSPSYGFIGYTDHGMSPYGDCKADCQYILYRLNNRTQLNTSAPETGGAPFPTATGNKWLDDAKKGSIARYYMTATLAGNAWVFDPAWSATQYFGNPYDQCIDRIKALGGDPFDDDDEGGNKNDGSNTGGDKQAPKNPHKKEPNQPFQILPSHIYLRGSVPTQLFGFIKFTRYNDMLTINYDLTSNKKDPSKPTDSDIDANSGHNDPEPANDKIKKMMAEVDKLRGHVVYYSNARPARAPLSVGYADCSGYVGWIIRNVYPAVWNNGRIDTGSMYTAFKRMGMVIWEGSMNSFNASEINNVKKGDILIMGQNPLNGAGNSQHTVLMLADGANGEAVSQEGGGTIWGKSISGFTHNWWHPSFAYFCVCRPK